ncbi:MAG: hypothetical protein P8Z71_00830 [Candidatus Sulfobium sp.]
MKKSIVIKVLAFVAVSVMAFAAPSGAMMGNYNGTTGSAVSAVGGMMGGGFAMTNNGGFGMMNGMAGAPVVGSDGTAYLVSYSPTTTPTAGTAPTSASFQSNLMAFSPSGGTPVTLALKGIVSRPVVEGGFLVATASLPDFSQFDVAGNNNQSVLYAVQLPLADTSAPAAVALDGEFASVPVIQNNMVYVTTTDFGNAMMGSGTFSMFNYDFSTSAAKSYLYIFNLNDGSLNKYEIQ